ncbi:YdcH family protein [Terrarubrum flagellatum]|uniref:YdcH family protein n=1 Tax=Terrirubrum flagellatum TaxID=2895980 RepID=UPI003144F20D
MSLQAHLAELEKRHQSIEREIEVALAHPSIDDLEIAELKRRKLQLKDEIAKLREGMSPPPTLH